jgi:hypothetical protein
LLGLAPLLVGVLPQSGRAQNTAPLPRFGVGVGASSLGLRVEAATAVTRRSNVRVGFNGFDYNLTTGKDGINYNGAASVRSLDAFYDYYLAGPFHVSPGVLLYDGNKFGAGAAVPGGGSFSLGGQHFVSSVSDPVAGTDAVTFNKAAPAFLLGFGNLLPRGRRQWGFRFDLGAAYQGSPAVALNLAGSTCLSQFAIC